MLASICLRAELQAVAGTERYVDTKEVGVMQKAVCIREIEMLVAEAETAQEHQKLKIGQRLQRLEAELE